MHQIVDLLRSLQNRMDHHAGTVLVVGLAAVACHNWRRWRRDQALLVRQPEPLPPDLGDVAPPVSVLVAAWNEGKMIEHHIESFLRLRYPRKELVLCAGGEGGTYDRARVYASDRVLVMRQEAGEGKQRALRRCYAKASGEIIFLTDADCLLDDNSFERTLAPVINGKGVASTGSSKPMRSQLGNAFAIYQGAVEHYASLSAPDASPGLLGRNCAIDRQVLEAIGAFEIDVPTGTDYILARQLVGAGYSIHFTRFSAVETEYVTTASAYFHQRSRWLRNLIIIGLRTQDYRQAYYGLRTAAVGSSLAVMPLLAFLVGPTALVPWVVLLAHGILSRIRYVTVYPRENGPSRLRLAAVAGLTLGLDLLVWGSVLVQCLLPSWRRRWS